MVLALILATLLAAPQTPLQELRRLELEIEKSRMLIPPTFDRESEEAPFRKMVEIAKLEATVTSERVATSPLELWRVEVAGRGNADDAAFLVEAMSKRDWRLVDLESLEADANAFKVRFTLPVFPPDPTTGGLQDRLARSRAMHDAIGSLRASRRLADVVSLIKARPESSFVRITALRVDGEMRVEGVALGAAARAEFLEKLKASGFAVPRMAMPPAGACRPFVLTAMPGSMQFTQIVNDPTLTSPLCNHEPVPAGGRIQARGTGGPLTLHLRNIELSDFFHVLNQLTGENFIVDPDVKARVDVQLENATMDETLAAIKGMHIGAAPLRRVSLTAKPGLTQEYKGEPVSMLLTEADLPSILCLFTDITGLKFMVPPNTPARITIFARDVPWDRIVDAMLASANLTRKIDGTQVFVGNRAGAVNACDAMGNFPSRFTSAPIAVEQLAKSDVEVAGVVQQDGRWKAYLHGPRHRLWLVEEGQKLFDAKVKSITQTGVVFE